VRFRVYSKRIYQSLVSLGVLPNKSHTGTFPRINNHELFRNYLRGVFDGDGCVTIRKRKNRLNGAPRVSIAGCEDFCKYAIAKTQRFAGINAGGVYRTSTIYSMEFSGFDAVGKFFDWLYQTDDIFLERKRNRFEEVLTKLVA
jgi:hypothetical protein